MSVVSIAAFDGMLRKPSTSTWALKRKATFETETSGGQLAAHLVAEPPFPEPRQSAFDAVSPLLTLV